MSTNPTDRHPPSARGPDLPGAPGQKPGHAPDPAAGHPSDGDLASPTRPARRTATAARVRSAVLKLLAAGGWPAVTHAEVARRAGVHRATVYRRWPERADLLLAAIVDAASRQVDGAPSSDPHHDVAALLRRTVDGLVRSRIIIDALLGARTESDDVDAVIGTWFDRREAGFAALLDAHRGRLPGVPDAVPHAFALGMGAAWGHVILRRRSPGSFDSDAVARTLVDSLSSPDHCGPPGRVQLAQPRRNGQP